MAVGFPLVLSGSQFHNLDPWRCDRRELSRLRQHFRKISADLNAKSAIADRCAAECRAELDNALKYELLGILKEREKQLRNPVGYDILRTIRDKEKPEVTGESRRTKLKQFSKPYSILKEDDDIEKDVRPYFMADDAKENLRSKRKGRRYRPLIERSRGHSLKTRVQFCKDMVGLVNQEWRH